RRRSLRLFVRVFMHVVLLLAALSACSMAHGQISPGPLARAHHASDSPASCTKCHAVNTRTPSFRCTDCHREIQRELEMHQGLHATYPQSGPPGSACVKCHSDHNGIEFKMLHWDPTPKGFDHTKTGFLLDGKHVGVGCRSCHNASHIAPSLRGLLNAKDLNQTYMGLTTECAGCHQDPHQGRFGSSCTQCHTTASWQGAKLDPKTFDHSRTPFPLTGMHQRVSCDKCHTPDINGQPKYTGLQFGTCTACHTDPHKGEFKQSCQSCHNTWSWTRSTTTGSFDHSRTGFPLLGKHQSVSCLACHKGGDFKTPVPHTQCMDCHADEHGGQFAKRPDGGRCESCHTVAGWSPSTFTLADHAKTRFPLVSPHARVGCNACHIPAGKLTRFKLDFALCVDCHKDPHDGQFAGAPWKNHCEQCHNAATFTQTSFTLAMHQKSTFPLTGGHMAVACADCHKPMEGAKAARFHFANLACTTCHEDIHHGQFAQRMAALGPGGKPLGCETCHTTREWADVMHFDHSRTSFPLVGAHRAAACIDCHRPPNLETNMAHVSFTTASTRCRDCHENPHGTQFGTRATQCESCHESSHWKPSLFDHEKTAFSLRGAHQHVACEACHTRTIQIEGKSVLVYKPTPTTCEACHGDAKKQTSSGTS
ncbi:MAG: hypothetical protein KGK08_14470, partial [Acidobacteriota bacterium]|nr:hypothetical protein [Acidobacteriota bacterium]